MTWLGWYRHHRSHDVTAEEAEMGGGGKVMGKNEKSDKDLTSANLRWEEIL